MYMNIFLWNNYIYITKKRSSVTNMEEKLFYLREFPFHNILNISNLSKSPRLYDIHQNIDSPWFHFNQ